MSRRKTLPGRFASKPVTLPHAPGSREWGSEKLAYEEVMGRPWKDDPPAREGYGAPATPNVPYQIENQAEWDAYYDAFDAWKESTGGHAWRAAHDRWQARREQFNYTARSKYGRQLLARVIAESEGLHSRGKVAAWR